MSTIIAAILVVTLALSMVEGQTMDCSQFDPSTPCPRSLVPMCGNDRVTYSNACVFCQRQREARNSGRTPASFLHTGDCEEENKSFRSLESNPALPPAPSSQAPSEEPVRQSVADILWPWLRQPNPQFYDRWEAVTARTQPQNAEPQLSARSVVARPLPRLPVCRGLDRSCAYNTPVCTSVGQTFPTECHVCDYNRYTPGAQTLIVRDGPCQ